MFHVSVDQLLKVDLRYSLTFNPDQDIRFLVSDIDGVLTDGGMNFTEKGDEFKKFNVKDGLGLKLAKQRGMELGFLSSGFVDGVISKRAGMFGVKYIYVGQEKKEVIMAKWIKKLGITLEQVAYVGDDLNDLEVLKRVGLSACPADASKEIRETVKVILHAKGGEGCLRELVDSYLK